MKYSWSIIRKRLYKHLLLVKYNHYYSNAYKHYLSNYKGYITGIKILINGRLASQKIKPRTTKFITSYGTFKHNSYLSNIHNNMYNSHNNIGAFTTKVWISHNFNYTPSNST